MKQLKGLSIGFFGGLLLLVGTIAFLQPTTFTNLYVEGASGTATPLAYINQTETGGDGGVPLKIEYNKTPVAEFYQAGDGVRIDGGLDVYVNNTPVASLDEAGVNTYGHEAIWVRYQDVANDAANNVYVATSVVSATTSVTTSITNPDYPRNLRFTYVTDVQATAGTFTITGIDARGNTRVANGEDFTIAAITGTQTFTGSIPWATITGFTLPTRTEAVTLTVGLGEKFCLGKIPAAAGDVFYFSIGNVYTSAYAVDTTWGTVLPTADIAANNDLTIGYKQ